MITARLELDTNLLRKIVLFYLAVGGNHEPQNEYCFDNIDEIRFKHIRATLIPVLKKREAFDYEAAKITVKSYLQDLLKFSDEEKRFIEEFNKHNYQPQLLFEDSVIAGRIANHPMALWKCRDKG